VPIENLHKHFHRELATASHTFFLWKAINNIAAADRSIYRGLNDQALTWNTVTHSLQTTFFIALGRLFDTNGEAFSCHSYLRTCINNIDEFGKDALRARKVAESNGREEPWLARYMEEAYVPTALDFQKLRRELSYRHARYETVYRPIRHQIFAHANAATLDGMDTLFANTDLIPIPLTLPLAHSCLLLELGRA
jgi:AbiU2